MYLNLSSTVVATNKFLVTSEFEDELLRLNVNFCESIIPILNGFKKTGGCGRGNTLLLNRFGLYRRHVMLL